MRLAWLLEKLTNESFWRLFALFFVLETLMTGMYLHNVYCWVIDKYGNDNLKLFNFLKEATCGTKWCYLQVAIEMRLVDKDIMAKSFYWSFREIYWSDARTVKARRPSPWVDHA